MVILPAGGNPWRLINVLKWEEFHDLILIHAANADVLDKYYLSEQMTDEVRYLIPPGNEAAASTASRSAGRKGLRRERAAFLLGIRASTHSTARRKLIQLAERSAYFTSVLIGIKSDLASGGVQGIRNEKSHARTRGDHIRSLSS